MPHEGGGASAPDDIEDEGRHRAPDTSPGTPAVTTGKRARFSTGFTSLRDVLSFVIGVAIIGNEVFLSDRVEIAFLTVGVTLTGLPLVFGADEKKR